jgi:CheY-like chemotaxis protein
MSNPSPTSVLVVEDHSDTARMLLLALQRKGIGADVVGSGEAALAHLHACKPRVVVMDEMMPGMSGMDVVRAMRNQPSLRDINVLFYTASFNFDQQREAKKLGAVAWFVKGVAPLSEVTATVEQLCH